MDEDLEFSVGGHEYVAGRLDAKRQFHVMRRLAPLFGGMAARGGWDASGDAALGDFLAGIGALPDEAVDYVLDHCLSVVKRRENGVLCAVSVATPGGGRALQYQDIDMAGMLTMVFHVLRRNFAGFLDAAPSGLEGLMRGAASPTSP
jgi:hypothetical protein